MQNKKLFSSVLSVFLLLALPSSTNYEMHDFGFGGGGSGIGDSSNYSMQGIVGELSGSKGVGTTYNLAAGLTFTQQSNVPGVPTLSNPSNYYNKLKIVINTANNPSDTLFAIAISTDSFVTTQYVQSDMTVGTSAIYQTYTSWGGASGAYIIGLSSGTSYSVKVKAVQTKYTETEFSSTATASTVSPTLSYDIDVSSTDTETSAPYSVSFGSLGIGTVTTATEKIWVDLDTNAEGGAFVYVYNAGLGLHSSQSGSTISSATGDLSALSEGYGVQVNSATQTSGGPFIAVSPYNGASNNIGLLDATSRNIFSTSGAPIVAGRGSVVLKAKASALTPAASDYSDTITMIASSVF